MDLSMTSPRTARGAYLRLCNPPAARFGPVDRLHPRGENRPSRERRARPVVHALISNSKGRTAMTRTGLGLAVCLMLSASLANAKDSDFKPLFNGKDLSGW